MAILNFNSVVSGRKVSAKTKTENFYTTYDGNISFTLYEYLNNIPSTGQGSVHFEDHGVALAQELFQFYVELQEKQKRFEVIEH